MRMAYVAFLSLLLIFLLLLNLLFLCFRIRDNERRLVCGDIRYTALKQDHAGVSVFAAPAEPPLFDGAEDGRVVRKYPDGAEGGREIYIFNVTLKGRAVGGDDAQVYSVGHGAPRQ